MTPRKEPLKTIKLHAKVDLKTDKKIRKLAKLTDFTISHIISELLKMSFKTGLAKDIFWLYLTDHSDPFLDAETSEDYQDIIRLKENITVIQSVVSEQEKRLKALEESQSSMVNGLKASRVTLVDYLKDVK